MNKKITLAIETAVGNGSLALFADEMMLDQWSDQVKIARSDRFLPILQSFLERNRIKKNDLDLIAVSLGPGSFTGARVGLATAMAMSKGLQIKCVGISVLRAIAQILVNKKKHDNNKTSVVAVLNDRGEVLSEKFASDNAGGFSFERNIHKIETFENFAARLNVWRTESYDQTNLYFGKPIIDRLVADQMLMQNLYSSIKPKLTLRPVDENLSFYIGKAVIMGYGSDNVRIYY
jgi:tRNA threonylcarbamoyl adenosine modification protein YeaZ